MDPITRLLAERMITDAHRRAGDPYRTRKFRRAERPRRTYR